MSVIEADPLFTQDIVHDFIISKGGTVTNKILVRHFRSFLNDTTRNVANRETFKNYVNTLSNIKVNATGEKVLVLKPKYKNGYVPKTNTNSTSLCNPPIDSSERPKKKKSRDPSFLDRSLTSTVSHNHSTYNNSKHDTSKEEYSTQTSPLSYQDCNTSASQYDTSTSSQMSSEYSKLLSQVDNTQKPSEIDNLSIAETVVQPNIAIPDADTLNCIKSSSNNNNINESLSEFTEKEINTNIHEQLLQEEESEELSDHVDISNEKDSSFSVKDRAKHLNNITDENQSTPSRQTSVAASDRSNNRNSINSNITLTNADNDPVIHQGQSNEIRPDGLITSEQKQWMIASSIGDYHILAKMLLDNSALVNFKDISMGYTALHWACKHGNIEILKLLCGTDCININTRSNGGYTACHIAAKNNHNEMINMLTQSYGADKDIRDYSGRRFKHYLGIGDQLIRSKISKTHMCVN